MKLAFHDFFLFTFRRLSNLWSNYFNARLQSRKKERYCVITVSIIVFNNKFHSNRRKTHSPDCLSSILFIDFLWLVLTPLFFHRIIGEALFRSPQKNEIINLLKSHFRCLLFFYFFFAWLNLQLMPMVNVITFMLGTIMLYHYDALLTGLPWKEVKPSLRDI